MTTPPLARLEKAIVTFNITVLLVLALLLADTATGFRYTYFEDGSVVVSFCIPGAPCSTDNN